LFIKARTDTTTRRVPTKHIPINQPTKHGIQQQEQEEQEQRRGAKQQDVGLNSKGIDMPLYLETLLACLLSTLVSRLRCCIGYKCADRYAGHLFDLYA
jgi:hypothetical protein